jgi:hypothetical protein
VGSLVGGHGDLLGRAPPARQARLADRSKIGQQGFA